MNGDLGQSPQRSLGAEPLLGGQGAKSPEARKLFSSWIPKGNGKFTTIFLIFDLFIIQQNVLSCIEQSML